MKMALPLSEILKEARSIPCFTGTDDYSLSNFMRDVNLVLGLSDPEHMVAVKTILANKLRGKALASVESLCNPTFEEILYKLREEFGIKKSYVALRNEAMNVKANNIKELHDKLNKILQQMNRKFQLEGLIDIMYMPQNNEKLIFDIYKGFLPCHIKTLLIQSQIENLNKALSFYIENNILHEISIGGVNSNNVSQVMKIPNQRSTWNSFSGGSNKQNGYRSHNFAQNSTNTNNRRHFEQNKNNRRWQNNSSQNMTTYQNDRSVNVNNVEQLENFSVSSELYNLPIAKLTIHGHGILCLIDSGSAITIGDYKTFKNIGYNRKLSKNISVRTLFGSQIVSEEVIVHIPSEFNKPNDTMSIKLLDFGDKHFQCILGANLLFPLHAIIDFGKNLLQINNVEISFINNMHNFSKTKNEYEKGFENYFSDEAFFPNIEATNLHSFNVDSLLCNTSNEEEKNILKTFLLKFRNIFYQEGELLSTTNEVKHRILTTPHNPIFCKNFRYPFALEKEINKQVQQMLNDGIIRPSKSPYNSPLWVVPKKTDNSGHKKWRVVVDYRKLNNVTIDDKFPLPNIESLFDKLGRSQYFTTIDLAKGFHQIQMDPSDIEKTAFSTANGHFEYTRMPFGLKNAPATFQRMINKVLSEFINKICVIYMDDILIFSASLKEHIESLTKFF